MTDKMIPLSNISTIHKKGNMILWKTKDDNEILQLTRQSIRSIYVNRGIHHPPEKRYVRILSSDRENIMIECPGEGEATNLIRVFWDLMTTEQNEKISSLE